MTKTQLQEAEDVKKSLHEDLAKIADFTADALVRAQDLGTTFNFEDAKPILISTLKLFDDLRETNLENVPVQTLKQVKSHSGRVISNFEHMQNFNPATSNNPSQERTQIIKTLIDEYQNHFNLISPIISYSYRKGTDFEELENTARNIVSQMEKASQQQRGNAESTLTEIRDTLNNVRRAAAEVGVAQHAIHFKEQADEHISKTRTWLIASAGFAALALGWGIFNLFFYLSSVTQLTSTQAIQIAIVKIIVFSIFYSASIWCSKLYKAQWHNYVINRHRQNALSTFETFVKAASDEQTKNAVLLQATQSIFAQQTSGFVSTSESTPSPQILEIIRGVVGVSRQET